MKNSIAKFFLLNLFLCLSIIVSAQNIHIRLLKQKEDSLKKLAVAIVMDNDPAVRFRTDSIFTRTLVRALKIQNSFQFPFDSILQVSRLYAPDSSFRIFTWQVVKDENIARRHGAIQMKTADGSLKLFPLIDKTQIIYNTFDTITSNESWIGAIYYRIIKTKDKEQSIYTLLGYDENNMRSTKKRMEILTFDQLGKPVFGKPIISFEEDTVPQRIQSRFWLEYKKGGNARFQFDDELNLIIYDHLIPEEGEVGKKYTYIPDGDYEGFKWKNGKWIHIDKVFNFALKDGEAPIVVPLSDETKDKKTSKPIKKKEAISLLKYLKMK
jgi:hypothetical protein